MPGARAALAGRLRGLLARSGSATARSTSCQLDVYGEVMDALCLARRLGLDARRGRLADAARPDGLAGERLAGAGRGPVGGPRRPRRTSPTRRCSPGLPPTGPCGPWRRRTLDGPGRPLPRAARRDPRRRLREGLRRRPGHVHPVLRLPRAGRGAAAHPPGRASCRRRTRGCAARCGRCARDLRGRRAGAPLRHRRHPTTACPATRAPSWPAASGWPTRWCWTGRSRRVGSGSSTCCRCATTSACSPRSTTSTTGRQLGNVPQAYSHLALVNSALNLAQVRVPGERAPAQQRGR